MARLYLLCLRVARQCAGAGVALLFTACCVEGSGQIEQREFDVSQFREIYIDVPADVHVRHSDVSSLAIRTDDNLFSHIHKEIKGNTLYLRLAPDDCCIKPSELIVYAETDALRKIDVKGTDSVVVEDAFPAVGGNFSVAQEGRGTVTFLQPVSIDALQLRVSGNGTIQGRFYVEDLFSQVEGTGNLTLSGTANRHFVDVAGTGVVHSANLVTQVTEIIADGTLQAEVNVNRLLDVDAQGNGAVYYIGSPTVNASLGKNVLVEPLRVDEPHLQK